MEHKAIADFDLHFETRPQYLHATLACRALTPEAALEILGEIMSRSADVHRKRIMVDCDLASIENDSDLLEAMLEMASMRSGSRIAFVNCKDSTTEHPSLSDEFQLFDDTKTAMQWLLSE